MEGLIAECGERVRIEEFLDKLCKENEIQISLEKKYQLIEDIQENSEKDLFSFFEKTKLKDAEASNDTFRNFCSKL